MFFKKRAIIEEEYGKSLQKLARSTSEAYSMNDGKAGYVKRGLNYRSIHNPLSQFICGRLAILDAST